MRLLTSLFLVFCACTVGTVEEATPDVANGDTDTSGSLSAEDSRPSEKNYETLVGRKIPITLIASMAPFSDAYREHGYPREERTRKQGLARVADAEMEANTKLAAFVTDVSLSPFSAHFRGKAIEQTREDVDEELDTAENALTVLEMLDWKHTGVPIVFLSRQAWLQIENDVFDENRLAVIDKKQNPWVGIYLRADYSTHVTDGPRRLVFDNILSLALRDLDKKLTNIADFQTN